LIVRSDISEQIVKDLEAGAYIYVCGATRMGSDVSDAFVSVVEKGMNLSHDKAVAYVNGMKDNHRYVQELWSA